VSIIVIITNLSIISKKRLSIPNLNVMGFILPQTTIDKTSSKYFVFIKDNLPVFELETISSEKDVRKSYVLNRNLLIYDCDSDNIKRMLVMDKQILERECSGILLTVLKEHLLRMLTIY
jgi:hypothetical protein